MKDRLVKRREGVKVKLVRMAIDAPDELQRPLGNVDAEEFVDP